MALTMTDARLLLSPERLLTVAPRLRAMAAPSSPVAATGASDGASGLTVTASVAGAVGRRWPSAAAGGGGPEGVKFVSLVGVIERLPRVQVCTSTEVLPALAVKV